MVSNFVKADSLNLPQVDFDMVFSFLHGKDVFNAPETRAVKEQRAARADYADVAVGYVDLERKDGTCHVRCKMCPEQKVTAKPYSVSVVINEVDEVINSADCHGCKAGLGGCKHIVAFLFWLNRRFAEPPSTSIKCYWKKSTLSSVGRTLEPSTVADFRGVSKPPVESGFIQEVVAAGSHESILHQYFQEDGPLEQLDMHHIARISFRDPSLSFEDHARETVTLTACKKVEVATRGQSDNPLWNKLRYGRITASILYEAAHCKTAGGSLVSKIIGASKVRDTAAMARGRLLEDQVLHLLMETSGMKLKKTGLFLSHAYPWLGASPDAMDKDCVVEVKCPSKESTVSSYVLDNIIRPKYMAQIQLQMFCCQRRRGIFCVADPKFEENSKVKIIVVDFDRDLVMDLISKAESFWKSSIYPRL